jgi:hypothetical protein
MGKGGKDDASEEREGRLIWPDHRCDYFFAERLCSGYRARRTAGPTLGGLDDPAVRPKWTFAPALDPIKPKFLGPAVVQHIPRPMENGF